MKKRRFLYPPQMAGPAALYTLARRACNQIEQCTEPYREAILCLTGGV